MSVVSAQSATTANVASSATAVTLFAARQGVTGRTVFNDSTAILYLKFGTGASTTSYTVQVAANGGAYEFRNPVYAGVVTGAWASANGFARTTEY